MTCFFTSEFFKDEARPCWNLMNCVNPSLFLEVLGPWVFFLLRKRAAKKDCEFSVLERNISNSVFWSWYCSHCTRKEEKNVTEDEMVEWHHRLNGHEFEQTSGDSEGQGSLTCCRPWGCKELDMTELAKSQTWLSEQSRTPPSERTAVTVATVIQLNQGLG